MTLLQLQRQIEQLENQCSWDWNAILEEAQKLEQQATTLNQANSRIIALCWQAKAHYYQNQYQIVETLFENNSEVQSNPEMWLLVGMSRYERTDYIAAEQAFETSRTLAKAQNNTNTEVAANCGLVRLMLRQGIFEAAIAFLEADLPRLEQCKLDTQSTVYSALASLYHGLAEDCEREKQPAELSLKHFRYALELYQKASGLIAPNDIAAQISLGNNTANTLKRLGQNQAAMTLLENNLALAKQINDKRRQAILHLGIARLDLQLEQPTSALNHLEQAQPLAQNLEHLELQCFIAHQFSRTYQSLGQYQEAFEYLEKEYLLDQKIRSQTTQRHIAEAAAQLKLERAQHQAEIARIRSQELEVLVRERTQALEQSQYQMLERLAMAAEFRDRDTGMHTQRVGILSAQLARAIGLDPTFATQLEWAARLHDIGKLGVPEAILAKPSQLNAEEWQQIKMHPENGAKLLAGSQFKTLELAREVALTHHERWDGQGFPQGLVACQIPIAGRIVAIIDAFDVMMHDRPYKKASSFEEAIQELKTCAARQFDPELVKAFVDLMQPELG